MQLVFRQEREPADSISLILSQLRFDLDGNFVLLGFTAIEKLHEELAFFITL